MPTNDSVRWSVYFLLYIHKKLPVRSPPPLSPFFPLPNHDVFGKDSNWALVTANGCNIADRYLSDSK